ncbi:MAG: type II toxin-antitoxin system HicB family antitoxin [Candidatus Gracilibacteria bacterium]|jgi:predicted RNase H-like HicB family nuclease
MKITKNRYSYTIIVRPEPEGGFTVTVPALPGCVTFGKNLTAARRMAEDAIGGYLKSLQKHGEIIPRDEYTLVSRLDLDLRHA